MFGKKKDLKKEDNLTKQNIENTAAEKTEGESNQEKKPVRIVKSKKVSKPKVKKPNIFIRMGKKIKEVFSELKKVTWPTFPTVLKQTGVVIAVVSIFLVIIFAFDSALSLLYGLLY